jgi:alkylated DNA repair dioxygenase AlkB
VDQLSMFESAEQILADDDRGRISYHPTVIPNARAEDWFRQVRDAIEWRAERRMMYEREVDVPRLMASFRLPPASEAKPPSVIIEAWELVRQFTGVPFNSVGLNRYRDGRDSVAPHNDHLSVLVEGHPIVLLSLGATRRMIVRSKAPPRRRIQIDLEAGSLLSMSYATQLHYTHEIPKTTDPVGERISLAFRVKTTAE